MRGLIEDRLQGSLNFDAINGDHSERAVVKSQVREAVEEIKRLRSSNVVLLSALNEAKESMELCESMGLSLDLRYRHRIDEAIRKGMS